MKGGCVIRVDKGVFLWRPGRDYMPLSYTADSVHFYVNGYYAGCLSDGGYVIPNKAQFEVDYSELQHKWLVVNLTLPETLRV